MAGAPKLIVLSEQFRGKTFELTKDVHTCGRVEERDICINDSTISSYHCDFVKTDNTFTLRDHGSTNGSRVNNVPATDQILQNSDIVQLGGIEFLYDCDDKSVTTVMRTQTGIELSSDDIGVTTVRRMQNYSPFNADEQSHGSPRFLKYIVIVLTLIIIGLLGFIALQTGLIG